MKAEHELAENRKLLEVAKAAAEASASEEAKE